MYLLMLDTPLTNTPSPSIDKGKVLRKLEEIMKRIEDIINIFQALLTREDSTKHSFESLNSKLSFIQLTLQVQILILFYNFYRKLK
jgi:hypothetical protein